MYINLRPQGSLYIKDKIVAKEKSGEYLGGL